MKIIKDDKCYIQGADLEFALYNDPSFPINVYYEMSDQSGRISDMSQYRRVKTKSSIEYIKKCDVVYDFDYLNNMSLDELSELKSSLERELRDDYEENNDEPYLDKAASTIKKFKDARRRSYELMQVNEMISFKKGKSRIDYPPVVEKPLDTSECKTMTPEEYMNRMNDKKYMKLIKKQSR